MDDFFEPSNGWVIEALHLAEATNRSAADAFDYVVLRYLSKGDPRALFHSLKHGKLPSGQVLKYLSAMIEPALQIQFPGVEFPFDVRFEETRKRGRPKRTSGKILPQICATLLQGNERLSRGQYPDGLFWNYLTAALDPTGYKAASGTDFPLKAKFFRTDGSLGAPSNPELGMRDRVLSWSAAELIRNGNSYSSAIEKVAMDTRVSFETVRNAYGKDKDDR